MNSIRAVDATEQAGSDEVRGNERLGMKLAMLQEDIDARDRRTRLVQRWFRFGLSLLGAGAEYNDELNDRRRLREWSTRIAGRWNEYVLSDSEFVDVVFPRDSNRRDGPGVAGAADRSHRGTDTDRGHAEGCTAFPKDSRRCADRRAA